MVKKRKKSNSTKKERFKRPKGSPVEVLELKDGFKIGSFGVENRDSKGWFYLTLQGWISEKDILKVEVWSPELTQKKTNEVLKDDQPKQPVKKPILESQETMSFAVQKMQIKVTIKDSFSIHDTDFKGKFFEPVEGFKTIKGYFKHLREKHGSKNISFDYVLK